MRFLLLAVLVFSFSSNGFTQSPDSLSTVDSSHQTSSYEALQDSFYRMRMQRSIDERGQVLEQFLADYKERQEREQRQTYIRIGLGVAFVAVLIYGLMRRRKSRQNKL